MHLAKSTENKPLSRGGNNTFIFTTLGARCKSSSRTAGLPVKTSHETTRSEEAALLPHFSPQLSPEILSLPQAAKPIAGWSQGEGRDRQDLSPARNHSTSLSCRAQAGQGPILGSRPPARGHMHSTGMLLQESVLGALYHRHKPQIRAVPLHSTALFPFNNTNLFNLISPPPSPL